MNETTINREKQIEEMEKLQDRLIKRSCTEYSTVTSMYLVEAAKAVGTLLEGYRKQREGAWGFDGMSWTCSECGEYAPISRKFRISKFKYCPNCGAKMKGGAE